MLPDLLVRLLIALALGLLTGLQRERVEKESAGIRTFALIALAGAVCGLLAERFGAWVVGAGILALAALLVSSNHLLQRQNACSQNAEAEKDGNLPAGVTTEVAAILQFALSAYVMHGEKTFAVLVGGILALLLYYKQPMHRFVRKLSADDVRYIMQFALISLVILPVLPDQTYGPYDVLNPFTTWLMVVLIVGIGLVGYLLYLIFGSRTGVIVGGLLGGLVSSTATTVSSSRETKGHPDRASAATLAIMLASAVSVVRVLIEAAVVTNKKFGELWMPLAAFLLVFVLISVAAYWVGRKKIVHIPPPENPAALKPAIVFGILYAVILLAVAFAKQHLGRGGLYAVSALSGLTDMDAITLSTSQLVTNGKIVPDTGWRLILTATLANLVFKGGAVAVLGAGALFVRVAAYYGVAILAGLAILFFWP